MILPVHDRVRARLAEVISAHFGIAAAEVPSIAVEMPPKRALGDLAVPVAFELARRLRKAPRAIAQDLAGAIGSIEGIARVEAAPNGYLNFFLDRVAFMGSAVRGSDTASAVAHRAQEGKVIVEHTAINPNKAAHIGHLRNSALGDTLVRLLRFRGRHVEVQNYIDDTGVQVADVVVGFRELEGQTLEGVKAIAAGTRFDFYCWDLYARVTEWYEADTARLKRRAETLHAIEAGGNQIAEMGAFIADRIVRRHLETMARLNIEYDLLSWEGDILRLHFWATAFEQLKARGSVYQQHEGKLAGCWVMKIEDEEGSGGSPGSTDSTGSEDETREKVIVRSDGTVTYVGKDIAYQFWKFGLLGRDFHYRPFHTKRDGSTLWSTTSEPSSLPTSQPAFGKASAVYNVIDTRQAYLQKLVKQALAAMGFAKEAETSTHFSYEMVALSHATARELGYDPAEGEGRPFVEVSGRKGLGVKADDLLDRLAEKAHLEVARRNEALTAEECRRIGIEIATAAVRYFMVKYSRGKVIAFDIEEALSFEGESGPYLQYAAVRAGNILQKLEERHGVKAADIGAALASAPSGTITEGDEADELWDLVLQAARLDEVAESAVRSLELSTLAKFAFTLAQSFNAFYHRQPILREEREDARLWRAAGVDYVRRQLTAALDLMGGSVPSRM